jgi:MFS family permease
VVGGAGSFLRFRHTRPPSYSAFLMLMNSGVDVGKGVLYFPILDRHGKRTALTYLFAMIVEVGLLAVGALACCCSPLWVHPPSPCP